jgi:Ca-activated chloride channel homolog
MENSMRTMIFLSCLFVMCSVNAQKANQLVEKGNGEYKKKAYEKADVQYTKALQKDPKNTVAQFNSGNAKQHLKKYDEASRSYEAVANNTGDALVKAKAYYNQGLAFIRQNKLKEAIEAFKKSVRLNANDKEARENLQKALKEQKQQQQPKNDDQQDNKNKKKQKNNDRPDQRKPKISKEDAEKMLNDLRKEEKNLQKQVQKKNQSSGQLKDW